MAQSWRVQEAVRPGGPLAHTVLWLILKTPSHWGARPPGRAWCISLLSSPAIRLPIFLSLSCFPSSLTLFLFGSSFFLPSTLTLDFQFLLDLSLTNPSPHRALTVRRGSVHLEAESLTFRCPKNTLKI